MMEREAEWDGLIVGFFQGLDGCFYAVFRNTDFAWRYHEQFGGGIACFGDFENAVCINETIGI